MCLCVSDIPFVIANKCDTEDGAQPDETHFSFVCSQWPVLLRCLLRMGGWDTKIIVKEVKGYVDVDVGFF